MVRITPVTLEYDPRPRWFDPGDLNLKRGDAVIVQTQRGAEFGYSEGIDEVDDHAIDGLSSPLQPVKRIATDDDVAQHKSMIEKGKAAFKTFKDLAAQTHADMRPIMVEYTFDGDRAIFFFEAEDRVDFRELVRRLASELHVHVDMHQIGVRDEARMVGGIGPCGQELCCRRMGTKFHQVTIRMAKEQGLSLNPEKVSGLCGRLMCCLRYEFDTYHEFNGRAPKHNAKIQTPEGPAKVVDVNVPKETVTVRLESDENNNRITFPLSAMDKPTEEGRKRPNSIGEAFEEYAHPDPYEDIVSFGQFDTNEFTEEDQLGSTEVHYNPSSKSKYGLDDDDNGDTKRSSRSRHGKGESGRGHRSRKRRNHESGSQRPQARGEHPAPSHHRRSLHRSHTSGTPTAKQRAEQERRRTQSDSASSQTSKRDQGQKRSDKPENTAPSPKRTHRSRRRRRTHRTGGSGDSSAQGKGNGNASGGGHRPSDGHRSSGNGHRPSHSTPTKES